MEAHSGTGSSIQSPQSEAVTTELQELSLQPAPKPTPVRERKNVLQLKLQQRRTREELVNQGIMPPLKNSAAFHEQRRSLERARTEDYLKRKIQSRPERSELIRMHILEETSAEPSLQAKQLRLKRARLADDLNDKISHRPGPMELIHKNILPLHSSIKQAIIDFPKVSGENSSFDEDSHDSLSPLRSPVQTGSQGSPLGSGPPASPPDTLAGSSVTSPSQFLNRAPPSAPRPPSVSPPSSPPISSLKLTNGTAALAPQRVPSSAQPKPNSDRSIQKSKKSKDNKPKIKKLKYHQYIPPDQRGDREPPPPQLDSFYAKILQQQQLFLQLQILNQQQHNYNYHTILPAPPKPQADQLLPPPSSCSSASTSTSSAAPSPPKTTTAPSATLPPQPSADSRQHAAPTACLPPNLDEMKVAELKTELKLRSLTVSGTKSDLIERLRAYQELRGGEGGGTSPPPAGATAGAGGTPNNSASQQQQQQQQQQPPSLLLHSGDAEDAGSGRSPVHQEAPPSRQVATFGRSAPSSPALTDHSPSAASPEDACYDADALGEMVSSPRPCLPAIKEEPASFVPAPCCLCGQHQHCQLPQCVPASATTTCSSSSSSSSSITTTTITTPLATSRGRDVAPTVDKDKMLREKDRQIEMLSGMLVQKQRLVEALRLQLEHGRREVGGGAGGGEWKAGGVKVAEPAVLVRVKEEPPDVPGLNLPPSIPVRPPSTPRQSIGTKVTFKQENTSEAVVAPQAAQLRLQQAALQLAQQKAIQKLLLQQSLQNQQNQQLQDQQSQNLLNRSQQRKKKSHKQQMKQQLLQMQHQQQIPLKQQALLKQQQLLLAQRLKQQQHQQQQKTEQPRQQSQTQAPVQPKQQRFLENKQQLVVQQSQKVSQQLLNQQPGSTPSYHLDLLKTGSTPTLVTDSNGNHFLIALTNNMSELPGTGSNDKTTITLQRLQSTPTKIPGQSPPRPADTQSQSKERTHLGSLKEPNIMAQKAGLQTPKDQSQLGKTISAMPLPKSLFVDTETVPSEKDCLSPAARTEEVYSALDHDVLLSPLSPASVKMSASCHDHKENSEQMEDLFDLLFQSGEISSFKPSPDPSLARLHCSSHTPSPPPSPLQLALFPPTPPPCSDALRNDAAEEDHQAPPGGGGGGRLEDFLESTTGKPLLGVEPGSPLTVIDDLHSQMLSTASILNHPPSPMDTYDLGGMADHHGPGADAMEWLDLTAGEGDGARERGLAPLAPHTPTSVFSTDFLDSVDLQIHWDSCL